MKIDQSLLDRLTVLVTASSGGGGGYISLVLDDAGRGGTFMAVKELTDGRVKLSELLEGAQRYAEYSKDALETPKDTRLYEAMIRFVAGDFTVRIWRQIKRPIGHQALSCDLLPIIKRFDDGAAISEVLDAILARPDVNAAEIVNSNGQGFVGYNNWP